MILAAGLGTRLQPYTNKLAKPVFPFLNLPMLCYPLYYLEKSEIKNLVVNTHHLPETVKEKVLKETKDQNYNVSFSDESPDILGTGVVEFKSQR